ncbi:MAG: cupredoxin domain-containing protein [Cumulibacter sp.]
MRARRAVALRTADSRVVLARRATRTVATGCAVLMMVAACSDSAEEPEKSAPSGAVTVEDDGTQVVDLRETEDYRFNPESPHVLIGKVRIDMMNTSQAVTHSLAFKPGGPDEEIPFINPGETKSIAFSIANPGEYKFFCTFHEQLGQRGTLTVEAP